MKELQPPLVTRTRLRPRASNGNRQGDVPRDLCVHRVMSRCNASNPNLRDKVCLDRGSLGELDAQCFE
jgi:hypothetical protein